MIRSRSSSANALSRSAHSFDDNESFMELFAIQRRAGCPDDPPALNTAPPHRSPTTRRTRGLAEKSIVASMAMPIDADVEKIVESADGLTLVRKLGYKGTPW